MINFLSDLVAYLWVGAVRLAEWMMLFGNGSGNDVNDLNALDTIDQHTKGNYVARTRYKVNHAFGGKRTLEYYDQHSQEFQGCLAGVGCIVLLVAAITVGIWIVL